MASRRSSKRGAAEKAAPAKPATMLVRIKPLNKRRGFVLRSYTLQRQRFVVDRGWYEVGTALAEQLAQIRQLDGDLHSPAAFDVVTAEEAKEIDAAEALGDERRSADDPDTSMTTADVTAAGRRARMAEKRAKDAEKAAAEKDRRIRELEAKVAASETSEPEDPPAEDDGGDEEPEPEERSTKPEGDAPPTPDPFE